MSRVVHRRKEMRKLEAATPAEQIPLHLPERSVGSGRNRRPLTMTELHASLTKDPSCQLAEGDTQGARHCLDALNGVQVFRRAQSGPYDGPLLVIDRDEATVTHPEHGDVVLPGSGRCYAVTYQRDLDAEDRERRVHD